VLGGGGDTASGAQSSLNDSRASTSELQDEEDLEYGSEVNGDDHDDYPFANACHNHGWPRLDLSHGAKHFNRSAPKLT